MKTKPNILKLALLVWILTLFSPNTEAADGTAVWTNRYNGPGNNYDSAQSLAVDSSGNVYVTGTSYDSSGSSQDYATIKYSSAGVAMWTNRYNGPGNSYDYAQSLAVDSIGNVYVTGNSYGGGSSEDYATVKYSSAGVAMWTNRYNGPGNSYDYAQSLAVDSIGNVYVTGNSYGGGSSEDYATVKYSSAGVAMWTNRYNGPGNSYDYAQSLALDSSGNVYVSGNSYDSGSSYDYATIKYSSAGVAMWTNRYNGPGNSSDEARSLMVDSSGNAFVTGYSYGSGNNPDYATIKYSSAGVPLWTNRYNGPGNSSDVAQSLAVDNNGNAFVTGYSYDSGSSYDYATIKYSSAGVAMWTNRYNGPGNNTDYAQSLAVDSSGNVYVTGYSYGSGGNHDYATIKYSNAGVAVWTNRFNGPGNNSDVGQSLAVDSSGNVYVTGNSYDSSGNNPDYATIKYSGGIENYFNNGLLDFVSVTNAGNANDPTTGYGAVAYTYSIGKYEATLNQYATFLNAVAATDTYDLYSSAMATDLNVAGISRSGSSGSYTYAVIGDGNRPVSYVNWFDAARFANWMHNGRPTGAQNGATTEDGAYSLLGATSGVSVNKNTTARYWIPSENEWYKAAYHQPASQGGDSDNYWLYPTAKNSVPNSRNGSSTDANSANFFRDDSAANGFNDGYAVSGSTVYSASQNYLTPVGAFSAAPSFYGTYDQGGNLWEWNDSVISNLNRGIRGGRWRITEENMRSTFRDAAGGVPTEEGNYFGFRLAATASPLITQQPQSQTVMAGSNAMLTVSVLGTAPLFYQWRNGGNPISDGGNWTGTSSNVLLIFNAGTWNAGNYDVVITNAYGSITSSVVNLTVTCPSITLIGPPTLTMPVNTSFSGGFSVPEFGSYSFMITSGSLPNGLQLATVSGPTVTIGGIANTLGTYVYTITATDNHGCSASLICTQMVVCPEFYVSPETLPAGNVGTPYNQIINVSYPGQQQFDVIQYGVTAGSLPNGLSLSTNGTLSGVPTTGGSFNFTLTATNLLVGCTGSRNYSIQLSSPPVINPPFPASVVFGSSGFTMTISATGSGPISYQWQLNGINISSANSSVFTIPSGTLTNAGSYTVLVSNPYGTNVSGVISASFFGDLKFYAGTTLAGTVGASYRIDYTDVLGNVTNAWQVLTNLVLPYSPYLVIDPGSPAQGTRFYRAVKQ